MKPLSLLCHGDQTLPWSLGFNTAISGENKKPARLGARLNFRFCAVLMVALLLGFTLPNNVQAALDFDTLISESERQNGFVPLHWHAGEGRLYAEVIRLNAPFIYYPSMSQGVGSNDLGLDRGRLGDTQLVQFERVGSRLLLVALNTRYRASSDNPNERRAVSEAFARSVLWGFDIAAEQGGSLLVDLTDFAQRDSLGLSALLEQAGEGSYALDAQRSVINMPRSKAFPDNTEVDALVTFVGHPEGNILRTVAPYAGAITLHLHHSFVRLPDDGYTPLPYDPRAGFIDGGEGDLFYDYAAPLGEPVKRGYARRHRLEKKHPDREMSEAIEPIVYYVDSGVPEPISSALVEGASWWNQAFEAAGFIDGFQVKMLPDGVDPMDVRYNVIQWVHRSTRGWSYGMSVRDPRTQEIIKGHVSLGSLRVRQDYLLAEGLLAPYKEGVNEAEAAKEIEAFALARIRQLSAHEVGHTIGLEHNFAASADDRASVMDYPHPYVTLTENNEVDISDAYAVGIGAWDKQAIRWGYADFPDDADAVAARAALMDELLASGLSFVADRHARAGSFDSSAGPSHSRGSLWDNGADPVAELNRVMALRRVVLDNFSEAVIRKGQPLAKIEDALVPAYLMHRYQLQAAATVLGGRDFTYALKGDGQTPTTVIDGERQQAALTALLATLSPNALALSPELVALIPPRPPMSGNSRELFPRETGYLFDPVAAAGAASTLTLGVLLEPKRAARLNQLAGVSGGGPNFLSVLDALFKATWLDVTANTPLENLLAQQVQRQMVDHLLVLATEQSGAYAVRAEASDALQVIKSYVAAQLAADVEIDAQLVAEADAIETKSVDSWRAHYWFIGQQIAAAAQSSDAWRQVGGKVPPGSPI